MAPAELPARARARDRAVAVDAASTADRAAGRYTFSPLGYDLPLFNVPRAEEELTHLAAEPNVAAPLRRRPLHDELSERRRARAEQRTDFPEVYFDDSQPVFQVAVQEAGGTREVLTPEEIAICDLQRLRRPARDRAGGAPMQAPKVGVDPVLGRLALPAGATYDAVEVGYAYGFPGDLGGGPYDRSASVARRRSPTCPTPKRRTAGRRA